MEYSERKPDYNSAALYYFREAQKTAKIYTEKLPSSGVMNEISMKEPDLNEEYLSFIRKKQGELHFLLEGHGAYNDDMLPDGDIQLDKKWGKKNLIINVSSLIARALFLLEDDSLGSDLLLYPGVKNNSDRIAS